MHKFNSPPITKEMTPAQLRAARALLDWSQDELSRRSGVSVATIRNFEAGRSRLMPANLTMLQRAVEDGGIEILPSDGVRRR